MNRKIIAQKNQGNEASINYEIDGFVQKYGSEYAGITTYAVIAIQEGGEAEKLIVQTLIRAYNQGMLPEDMYKITVLPESFAFVPGLEKKDLKSLYNNLVNVFLEEDSTVKMDIDLSSENAIVKIPEKYCKQETLQSILQVLRQMQYVKKDMFGIRQYENRKKVLELILLIYKGSMMLRGDSYLKPLEYNYRTKLAYLRRLSGALTNENTFLVLRELGLEKLKVLESIPIDVKNILQTIHDKNFNL